MRIGAALTHDIEPCHTFALEMQTWRSAPSGLGTLTFELIGETRLSYLDDVAACTPLAYARTQPAFRAIPDAARVAAIFAEAAETRVSMPQVSTLSHLATLLLRSKLT